MFDRFGDDARAVVGFAHDAAGRLGHEHVGTEHLLLGLLGRGGRTADLLRAGGATLDGCRSKVAEWGGRPGGRTGRPDGELDRTERAQRVLQRADRLSLRRRDPEVGPAHLLASLLDVEGTAGQVLRGVGADVAVLRGRVVDLLDQPEGHGPAGPAGPDEPPPDPIGPGPTPAGPELRCPACGTGIVGGLRSSTVESADDDGGTRPVVIVSCRSCGTVLGARPA